MAIKIVASEVYSRQKKSVNDGSQEGLTGPDPKLEIAGFGKHDLQRASQTPRPRH